MKVFPRTHLTHAPGWPIALVAVFALFLGDACGRTRSATPAASTENAGPPPPPITDPHAWADLPPICAEYRRKLLRCTESDHYPQQAKDGQKLALQQMMVIVREEQRRGDPHGAALRAAEDNCRDSLSTMSESGKETCPGVF